MQFSNKNNDIELIAQVLSNRRQPVSGGSVVLSQQSPQKQTSFLDGMNDFLGGANSLYNAFKKPESFDFEGMKNKYSNPYTTNDMANNTFGGVPSIDYGLPTKQYDWMPEQKQLDYGYGLNYQTVPQFKGFGG